MRYARLIGGLLILASVATGWAEQSFDEKYERDYNLFNSITRDQPVNPLNPTNAYSLDNPFNPVNQYDPNNLTSPINQFNFNNPFNPVNRYRPENPLNPVKEFNPNVPFVPFGGGIGQRR